MLMIVYNFINNLFYKSNIPITALILECSSKTFFNGSIVLKKTNKGLRPITKV